MPVFRTRYGECVFLTPEQWVNCTEPTRMVVDLTPFEDPRRARLAILACLEHHWDELPDEARAVVEVGFRFVEGEATPDEVASAQNRARAWYEASKAAYDQLSRRLQRQAQTGEPSDESDRRELGRLDWHRTLAVHLDNPFLHHFRVGHVTGPLLEIPVHRQCDLLRCVYRHPLTSGFDPAWRTTDTLGLARSMYETRDYSAMPILADALEEAGCESSEVLAHCRVEAPHVRGCWVVDLLLGK